MKTKFWPPQFFNGQRGCGCCQPPPPPPPPLSAYYGYYGGRVVRQLNQCAVLYNGEYYNFCHSSDGSATSEDPVRYWLLEIDSIESVTSESPDDPYGGCDAPATATTCENANGTFILNRTGGYQTADLWGERIIDGSPAMLRHVRFVCEYTSPVFPGPRKKAFFGLPDPFNDCYRCLDSILRYRMELSMGLLVKVDGGDIVGSVRTADLFLEANDLSFWVGMAQWASPQFSDNDTYIGPLNIWTNFQCQNNNVMPLVYAEDGYGPLQGGYMQGWPRCCTNAPNAIEVVPL